MAIDVTTWSEFLAALADSSETDINIVSDLDCNDSPMTGDVSISRSVVINGNSHSIYNLTTAGSYSSSLSSLFYVTSNSYNVTVKNLNFYNVNTVTLTKPIFGGSGSAASIDFRIWIFDSCQVQGNAAHFATSILFDRGSITLSGLSAPWCSASPNNSNARSRFTNSWLSLTGEMSGSVPFDRNVYNTCYIEGTITKSSLPTDNFVFYNPIANCCVNIELTGSQATGYIRDAPTITSVVNSDRWSGASYPTPTDPSQYKLVEVTDSQMQDASYLASVGFNIVV